MKKSRNIRISQCMIVKNEEKNMERALSWGKGIVAEQIVVDTGSTDRTVEIAKAMGAEVYYFPWVDDFAAAKNFAIEKAKYEWIAFLDADEYFMPEDAKKLVPAIEKADGTICDGIATGWIHLDDEGKITSADTQIRIFRNLPTMRYKRRIHEYLTVNGHLLNVMNLVDKLPIFHTGYSGKAYTGKKESKRNLKLILAELEDHPDEWEMWGYLGNEYDAVRDFDEAEKAYRKGISLMPEHLRENQTMASEIYMRLLQLLTFLPEPDEAGIMEVYEQAVKAMPKEGNFDYMVGQYFATHGNCREGEKYLRRALKILEQYGNMAKSEMLAGNIMRTYEMLAMCCFNNGNLSECIRFTTALLKENHYLMSTLVVMLTAFRKDEAMAGMGEQGAAQVAAFLEKSFYNFQSLKDRLFVLRAAMASGYGDLVTVMRKLFTPEELEAVDRALKQEQEKKAEAEKTKRPEGSEESDKQETEGKDGQDKKESQRVTVEEPERKKLRIVLFYSEVESFNFFTDRLDEQLRARGHETFIVDLRNNVPEENPHSYVYFNEFISGDVDAAICFDALGVRTDLAIDIWDQHQAVVVDILMDAPTRIHSALVKHSQKYILLCCDRDHVEYVKRYYKDTTPRAFFMPHAGVLPPKDAVIIPYKDRKYDILFSATYYPPEKKLADLKAELEQTFPGDKGIRQFYGLAYENLLKDSSMTVEQSVLATAKQLGWAVSDDLMRTLMYCADSLDWAVRMYYRGQVVKVLAEAGFRLHLLGRGWENHPSVGRTNVFRVNDRVPYGETFSYMADAKINLNVMPWFKAGTHDRIFNTLLQHSVPLTDSSTWIDENFTDGRDIALYDLKRLDRLPEIAGRLLTDTELAENIIENGYRKTAEKFTWTDCADKILEIITQGQCH